MTIRTRWSGSAALSPALTAHTSDGGDLLTHRRARPATCFTRGRCTRSVTWNMAGGAEEGTEGGAAVAFPTLPYGLNLSLDGDPENHGAWQCLTVLVHLGPRLVGSTARHLNSFHKTLARMDR